MKDENVTNFRHSYSYSYSLMMTPASSSTVAVFHRRVGRCRIPITRYLARRAVRRRTSSTMLVGIRQFPSVPLAFPAEPDINRRRLWAYVCQCPLPFFPVPQELR